MIADVHSEIKQTHREQGHLKPMRKKQLKLLMHPPSIPTQFQTFHYNDHESKAFNATASRFNEHTHELPGPGYYEKSSSIKALQDATCVSTKGLGIGFTSNLKRFKKLPTETQSNQNIGPGVYDIAKDPVYYTHSNIKYTAAFKSMIAVHTNDSKYVKTPSGALKDIPGPNTYNPTKMTSNIVKNGSTCVFKSTTKRLDSPGRSIKALPPPGLYDPNQKTSHNGAVAAFKAVKRDAVNKIEQGLPGPADYHSFKPHKDSSTTAKTLGRPGPFISIVQFIGSNNEQTKKAQSPSVRRNNDSVASSSSGLNKSRRGNHRSSSITNKNTSHEPSKSVAALEPNKKKPPIPSSVFSSSSRRFSEPANFPGPGFYHPIRDIKFRSFHLNLEKLWT